MSDEPYIPKIITGFDMSGSEANSARYREAVCDALKKILPPGFFPPVLTGIERDSFESLMPMVTCVTYDSSGLLLSFFALTKYRSNSFRFFFEMITHWLVPGKRLNVVLVYATDFRIPDISSDHYTLCEVIVAAEDDQELAQIKRNLPLIESELRLGLESSYYARRILEIKGLAADEKMAMVQEYIARQIKRLPQAFDIDVLTEMQHVLITCRDEFKMVRSSRHLSRIICVLYLFRQGIRRALREAPEERHLNVKLFKSKLHSPAGIKHVLAIIVGLNFIRDREVFDKKHLLQVVQSILPVAQAVEQSFFVNRHGLESIRTLYLEIERNGGGEFSADELCHLRKALPGTLKERITHLLHPVFMPRNEEEIMRHIVNLSNQIKYIRDIPQVVISFDEQTDRHLSFLVILVRVTRPGSDTIQAIFKKSGCPLEYIHDHSKILGTLRKKYCKEMSLFRIKLPKENFLRRDHNIDLYKARQNVVSQLSLVVGEFRDFNGGMITKQNELLSQLKDLLGTEITYDDLLLENFFFSLSPVIMRTLLEPEALKRLFLMLLAMINTGPSGEEVQFYRDIDFLFVLMRVEDAELRNRIDVSLNEFQLHSTELARSSVKLRDIWFDGYIFRSDDPAKQLRFQNLIESSVAVKV
jgi:hypothetical protein